MPHEIAVMTVIVVSVLAGTTMFSLIAWMFFRYLREKNASRSGAPSMTTSELETMLRRVVEEANSPLLDRIELLESQVNKELETIEAESDQILSGGKEGLLLENVEEGPRDLAAISRKKSYTV